MTTNTASAIFAGITPCSSASCIANTSCCAAIVISPAALPSSCCGSIVLCRRHHCDAVVVVHCSTPFGASDALAPMNYCATVRPARLLASSPREARVAPLHVPPRAVSPRLLASCDQQWCIRTECNNISHLNCYHFSSSYCDSQPSPYLNHHVDHINSS